MFRKHADVSDWHVFNRGSRRMALFHDDQDSRVFLMRLRDAAALTNVALWAYTLMTNHFHLVLRATWLQLGRFMHRAQMLFSRYHNQRYDLSGHAFAGPYGAVLQRGQPMLLRTLAYVFMNPVAARRTDSPADWTWTSYREFLGRGRSWLPLNVSPLLAELDPDPDLARSRYLEVEGAARLRLASKPPAAEPTATQVHCDQFEWLLERAQERSAEFGDWNPVLMAILWAEDVGIFRTAVKTVLGGAIPGQIRWDLPKFRAWLSEDSQRAASLRVP